MELPSHPVPLEHGGLRGPNDVFGSSNLSIIPNVAEEEAKLLRSSAATDGSTREIMGQPGQSR